MPSVPSAPADLFKHHIPVETTLLAVTATAFKSSHYKSSCFRRGDTREAWDGGGQVAHDMTDSEGTVFEEDTGQVVLGKQTRSDGSNCIQVIQLAETASCKTVLRGVLGLGVLDSIFKINVGIDVGGSGGSERSSRGAALVGLWRKGRGDGVGRSRKTGILLLDRQRSGRHGGEAVLAGPKVIARLVGVDGLRHSSQSQSDGRVGVDAGRSHDVASIGMNVCIFLC